MEKENRKITYLEFIRRMSAKYGLYQDDCRKAVRMVFDLIEEVLLEGDSVAIPGFGHFCVKKTKSRNGTDPNTLESKTWNSANIPKMYCSENLKRKFNEES